MTALPLPPTVSLSHEQQIVEPARGPSRPCGHGGTTPPVSQQLQVKRKAALDDFSFRDLVGLPVVL